MLMRSTVMMECMDTTMTIAMRRWTNSTTTSMAIIMMDMVLVTDIMVTKPYNGSRTNISPSIQIGVAVIHLEAVV